MKSLALAHFIKPQCITEAVTPKPLRLFHGTKVEFEGSKWEAIKETSNSSGELGWIWKWIGGTPLSQLSSFGELFRNPPKVPGVDPNERNVVYSFFPYKKRMGETEHPIYTVERFNQDVVSGNIPKMDTRKSQEVGTAPPGVIDAESAYKYAKTHSDWPVAAAEHFIKRDPRYSFLYARDVLQNRFPNGELAIKSNPDYWAQYQKMISRLSGN